MTASPDQSRNGRPKRPFQLPERSRAEELYQALRPAYDEALQRLQRQLRGLLEGQGFTPTLKYRVKRFADYYEKLQRSARKKGGPPAITDLLGLRVVCPFLEDVEQVERLIREHFDVVETVRKAAGHSFREFGYDSVHFLVRVEKKELAAVLPHTRRVCEIQLRTILQDAWAEVEHELVYKSRLSWPNESIRRKLAALNATLTLSDLTFQEIRDYQNKVRALDHKRRSALDQALAHPGLHLEPSDPEPPHPAEVPVPVSHGSPLEKAMLAPLQAHSRHHFTKAVELYSRILAMRMDRKIRALIYNHRGMAHFAMGHPKAALRDFSRAIHYDENNLRAYCNRALVFRQQKRLAQALDDYDRALELAPETAATWLGRAQIYSEMDFPDRALADCQAALRLQPDLVSAQALDEKIRREFFTG